MQVLVSFPGSMSLEQFEDRIQTLHKLGAVVHLETGAMVSHERKTPTDPFIAVAESLTENEEKLADLALSRAYQTGEAPLLEALTVAKVGRLRPYMSLEILEYYQKNPGHTKDQGAWFLAEKFVKQYRDINDGFSRIKNLIQVMCYAKGNQHALESRGGHHARNKPIFVVE
jgi:hypothetical protein